MLGKIVVNIYLYILVIWPQLFQRELCLKTPLQAVWILSPFHYYYYNVGGTLMLFNVIMSVNNALKASIAEFFSAYFCLQLYVNYFQNLDGRIEVSIWRYRCFAWVNEEWRLPLFQSDRNRWRSQQVEKGKSSTNAGNFNRDLHSQIFHDFNFL